MGLGKKKLFSWKLLKWIYSVLEKSSSDAVHQGVLTWLNHCFCLKYESSIHIIAFSSEKLKYILISSNVYKPKQFLKNVGGFWCKRTTGDELYWRKVYYRIMDSHFSQKWQFKVKMPYLMYLFLTNAKLFASQDIKWWTGFVWITCGLLWCFYQLFELSFWRHPFTAEHPLVSYVMLNF